MTTRNNTLASSLLSALLGMALGFLAAISTYNGRMATLETKVSLIYTALDVRGWISPQQRKLAETDAQRNDR